MTESAVATKSASRWEDFLEIFIAPSQVFARREQSGFWIPLVVLAVVMTALYYATADLTRPIFEAEFARGMAKSAAGGDGPQLTEEQIAGARAMSQRFAGVAIGFFFLVGPLLTGLVLWLAGKVVGARQAIGAAMVVAVYSFFPRILEGIVNAVQAFLLPEESLDSRYSLSLGPARLLDPDAASPVLLALLGRVDVFTLWVTVLLAIGLKVTGRVTTGQAAVAAAIVWLVGALPPLLGALR